MTTSAVTPPIFNSMTQQKHQHQHSIQMLHHSVASSGMPHGLGLLTTVASLPPKYRSRYLSINTKTETPLDLSVKPFSPQIANDVPIATSFTEVYTEPSSEPETTTTTTTTIIPQTNHQHTEEEEEEQYTTLTNAPYELMETIEVAQTVVIKTESILPATNTAQQILKHTNDEITTKSPITPPPTPNTTKRKLNDDNINQYNNNNNSNSSSINLIETEVITDMYANPTKMAKTNDNPTIKRESTPIKPIRPTDAAPKTIKAQPPISKSSKNKATRKLKFDEETSSPVSGTIIRPLEDITDGTIQYSNGDIDPKYNIVEITEETKAELAAIKNVIGDYICKLCRLKFDDAFGLAQHRCACIVLLEYRCPECGKQFNCPANLASHRRWHKPKKDGTKKENRNTTNISTLRPTIVSGVTQMKQQRNENSNVTAFACDDCGKKFKRQAYLRKHQLTHTIEGKKIVLKTASNDNNNMMASTLKTTTTTTTAAASVSATTIKSVNYQSYIGSSSSGASISSSSSSSLHSYSGVSVTHDDDVTGTVYMVNSVGSRNGDCVGDVGYNDNDGGSIGNYNSVYDYDGDSMSDCSNSSTGYGRLQIVESGLTEEENIAAAALTNLRNCASVIQHTTLAH